MRSSSSNAEAAKDCFVGKNDQVLLEVQSLQTRPLYRTQDIKVLLPKFSIATKGEITDENRAAGHTDTTFLDKLNRLLIENDGHYSKFKFERQSNFKADVVNTLGLFENQTLYKKLLAMLNLVG